MRLKALALAAVVVAGFILPVSAGEQSGKPTELSPELQASIRGALQSIAASPADNEQLLDAVQANYESGIRDLLIEHGMDAAALSTLAIDAGGAAAGPRKQQPDTLYLAVGGNPADPQGLVYMGRPYGWVDWNTFDPWAYF